MQALGTTHHYLANLSDDEARILDSAARAYYLRVLTLMNDTQCTIRQALEAVAAAVEQEKK